MSDFLAFSARARKHSLHETMVRVPTITYTTLLFAFRATSPLPPEIRTEAQALHAKGPGIFRYSLQHA